MSDFVRLSNRHASYKDNEKATCTSRLMCDLHRNPFQGNNIQVNKVSGHKSSHTRPYIVFVRNRKPVIGLRRLSWGNIDYKNYGDRQDAQAALASWHNVIQFYFGASIRERYLHAIVSGSSVISSCHPVPQIWTRISRRDQSDHSLFAAVNSEDE